MSRVRHGIALVALVALSSGGPARARDSLGVFGEWGAFRDAETPRCYAIALAVPAPTRESTAHPYADVALWPRRGVRGQVHFRLSYRAAPGAPIALELGGRRVPLTGAGLDAWAADARGDAEIVAAMRAATDMMVRARREGGKPFGDLYRLAGAASAIDAALIGCAKA